ncbi:MAG: fructose-6-phosphate aldolase [Candidatus Omnitrophica bacterium]|nr:fructose-6-phosphate aldolase [Candidatus Omnitrophota bacterium]MCF7898223.1 fructose-6-phosphate aldolase [Candidatus Omnitrophota bacterium]MCF7910003.1 fructose-6-phosphate aldolase [Candidatus Omnitrophota bacterium]
MKLFIDTANLEEIKKACSYGVLDGVTTNPTLLSREGSDPIEQLKKIVEVVDGPVSAEVTSLKKEEMVKEAGGLAKIASNIVIKVPCTTEGLAATKELSLTGVKTNLTLCFSASQALLVAKAGATFVSPFVGRLDDISAEGMDLVSDIKVIYDNFKINTEIIVASIRHPIHFLEAARIGADIATVPFAVIEKLMKHPLTDIGIERFMADWDKLKKQLNKE